MFDLTSEALKLAKAVAAIEHVESGHEIHIIVTVRRTANDELVAGFNREDSEDARCLYNPGRDIYVEGTLDEFLSQLSQYAYNDAERLVKLEAEIQAIKDRIARDKSTNALDKLTEGTHT